MRYFCTDCEVPFASLNELQLHRQAQVVLDDYENPHTFKFKLLYELRMIRAAISEKK